MQSINRTRTLRAVLGGLPRSAAAVVVTALVTSALTAVSLVQAPLANAASGDIGIRGAGFSGFATTTPTAPKPESKLWFAQGSWWASMASTTALGYRIKRLDRSSGIWIDSGVDLDTRGNTQADVLWNGQHLFVASHVIASSSSNAVNGQPIRLFRYSWDGSKWGPDAGFPVTISTYSAEAVTLAQDTTGRLWSTFTRSKRLYVASSVGNGDAATVSFGSPYIPSLSNLSSTASTTATTLSSDDLSGVVSDGGVTTVLWSNQTTGTFYSARHLDSDGTTWSALTVVSGTLMADDHMNIKTIPGDAQGRVFAVLKTSRNDASPVVPTDPLLLLAVFTPSSGTWATSTLATVSVSPTRPILVLEPSTDTMHAYFTAPTTDGITAFQGSIYEKTTSISAPAFSAGKGTPVIRDITSATMNNATSTKQVVDATSGTVVLAATEGPLQYWHSDSIGATLPPAPVAAFSATPTSGTAPVAVTFTDTSTGTPTSWAWEFGDGATSTTRNPGHTYSAAGSYTAKLTATNAGGSTSSTTTITVTAGVPLPPVAAFTATPTSGAAPLAVTFTDTSTGAPTSWAWDFGDGTTSTTRNPSHTYSGVGTFTAALTATNVGGSTSSNATITVSAQAPTVVDRVNVGGAALTGGWSADTAAAPSPWVNDSTAITTTSATTSTIDMSDSSIPAGTPASLFQNIRYDTASGGDMVWTLPVPSAGRYTVRLYFAETYFTAAGKRTFNVSINGNSVLSSFDVFAAAGGTKKAIVRSFTVDTTGSISVNFGRTTVNNPMVNGIEVLTS